MTTTNGPGPPAASVPCAERRVQADHIHPDAVRALQARGRANCVCAARPDSAASLAGGCKAWRALSAWRPSRHRLRGTSAVGRSDNHRKSAAPASPLNRMLETRQSQAT
jgi:hypothetical protein